MKPEGDGPSSGVYAQMDANAGDAQASATSMPGGVHGSRCELLSRGSLIASPSDPCSRLRLNAHGFVGSIMSVQPGFQLQAAGHVAVM